VHKNSNFDGGCLGPDNTPLKLGDITIPDYLVGYDSAKERRDKGGLNAVSASVSQPGSEMESIEVFFYSDPYPTPANNNLVEAKPIIGWLIRYRGAPEMVEVGDVSLLNFSELIQIPVGSYVYGVHGYFHPTSAQVEGDYTDSSTKVLIALEFEYEDISTGVLDHFYTGEWPFAFPDTSGLSIWSFNPNLPIVSLEALVVNTNGNQQFIRGFKLIQNTCACFETVIPALVFTSAPEGESQLKLRTTLPAEDVIQDYF